MIKILNQACNGFSSLRSKTYLQSLPYLEKSNFNENHDTAVLMLNLGGPNSMGEVTPFLTRFFTDDTVIRIPFGLGPYIAKLRGPAKINKQYSAIGGFSPLLDWTLQQGASIEKHLSDLNLGTIPAFRYGLPLQEDAIEYAFEKSDGKLKNIVLFSQYPQYSCTTGGNALRTSLATLQDYKKKYNKDIEVQIIDQWHKHPGYIDALATILYDDIKANIPENEMDKTIILFSAHSLPADFVWDGDKYPYYIYETAQHTIDALKMRGINIQFELSFQSKVGFQTWVQPATEPACHKLITKNPQYKNIILSPIGFTSDHLETLYELDQELFDKMKKECTIHNKTIMRAKSLNNNSIFTKAQADIVRSSLDDPQKGRRKRCHNCQFIECNLVNTHSL